MLRSRTHSRSGPAVEGTGSRSGLRSRTGGATGTGGRSSTIVRTGGTAGVQGVSILRTFSIEPMRLADLRRPGNACRATLRTADAIHEQVEAEHEHEQHERRRIRLLWRGAFAR